MRPLYGILDAEILIAKRKRTFQKASLLKRFLNLLIDYLAIMHFSIFVGVLLGMFFVGIGKTEWVAILKNTHINVALSWFLIFIYYVVCEHYLNGMTLGKYATQTQVRSISGEKANLDDIIVRTLLRLIPLEPISIFFGKSWHDQYSSTMVVCRWS